MKPEDKHESALKKVKRKVQKKQYNLSQRTVDYSKWLFETIKPSHGTLTFFRIVFKYTMTVYSVIITYFNGVESTKDIPEHLPKRALIVYNISGTSANFIISTNRL